MNQEVSGVRCVWKAWWIFVGIECVWLSKLRWTRRGGGGGGGGGGGVGRGVLLFGEGLNWFLREENGVWRGYTLENRKNIRKFSEGGC